MDQNAGQAKLQGVPSRFLFSEDLRIPTIATWWCGQPKELNYVLENLSTLVIGSGEQLHNPLHRYWVRTWRCGGMVVAMHDAHNKL